MSNKDVITHIQKKLLENISLSEVCNSLTQQCYKKGSQDNITAVLVLFPGAKRSPESDAAFTENGEFMFVPRASVSSRTPSWIRRTFVPANPAKDELAPVFDGASTHGGGGGGGGGGEGSADDDAVVTKHRESDGTLSALDALAELDMAAAAEELAAVAAAPALTIEEEEEDVPATPSALPAGATSPLPPPPSKTERPAAAPPSPLPPSPLPSSASQQGHPHPPLPAAQEAFEATPGALGGSRTPSTRLRAGDRDPDWLQAGKHLTADWQSTTQERRSFFEKMEKEFQESCIRETQAERARLSTRARAASCVMAMNHSLDVADAAKGGGGSGGGGGGGGGSERGGSCDGGGGGGGADPQAAMDSMDMMELDSLNNALLAVDLGRSYSVRSKK